MKSIFKIICLTAILLTAYPSAAQNYTMKNSKNYEVVNLGVATDGTKLIKVYVTHRNKNKAIAEAKKAAIETIIFSGVPSAGTVSGTPALCSIADEQKHASFFEKFFVCIHKLVFCYSVTPVALCNTGGVDSCV
jgi:hypothetical protein